MSSPTPQSNLTSSLPHDLLLSCVARVSRLYYPTLSVVSKSFRSLLASPELYKARSLLDRTESCLYVCLKLNPLENPSWFTLCLKPNQTLTCDTSTKKKSSGYVLATVPILNSHPVEGSSLVAVGSNIYNIGGSISPSSSVLILDCMTHTWREAPSLQMKLKSISASVLDRKIYVVGNCKDGESESLKNTFEVFDTETQIWDHVPSPYSYETKQNFHYKSACIDEKWYVLLNNRAVLAHNTWIVGSNRAVVAYNPKKSKWDLVGSANSVSMLSCDSDHCEIENVLYSVVDVWYPGVEIRWYDTEVRQWRKLEGLVGLPKFSLHARVTLADYGGKMAVLWEENTSYDSEFGPNGHKKMLWCAVITLERRKNLEIWGNVEWFDYVLRVPKTCGYEKVLAATV